MITSWCTARVDPGGPFSIRPGRRLPVALTWILLSAWVYSWPKAAASQSGEWSRALVDEPNGIVVDTRVRADGYTEFRGMMTVQSRLTGVVALLRDVPHMSQWVYRTRAARILDVVNERELVIHSVARAIWPLHDRDLVVRTRLAQDPETLVVRIDGQALPDHPEPTHGRVRVPLLQSTWILTPLDAGQVKIEFQGFGDGGGNLSSPILNWFTQRVIIEAPHQTLIGLRSTIIREPYQSARLAFIREPGASNHPGGLQTGRKPTG